MSRAAMQQALDALHTASSCLDGYYIPAGKTTLPEIADAVAALEAALAEPPRPLPPGPVPTGWKLVPVVPQPLTDLSIAQMMNAASLQGGNNDSPWWLLFARAVEAEVLKRMGEQP